MKKTVEKINNKFDLILIAARRARQIQILEKENLTKKIYDNKCTTLALRELEKD